MSSSTIARWNAIPMSRDGEPRSNKRSRSPPDDDDSSEDNVSLVSRSPSPQPGNADVEMKDIYLYDEHVRGPAREVITVETKIKSSNVGFALLAKMGWSEGQPLGISGEGRTEPIPFTLKNDSTGLGKVTQDFRMIETTVSQRRGLDSERMQNESDDQRRLREESVAQKAAVQDEISSVLRAFYCTLCDKQFKNVAQYDEHTNSYAHHHKARMKDMHANHPIKAVGKEETDRRREKERKREERELKKIAAAAGIKIAAPAPIAGATPPLAGTSESGSPKKSGGWASLSSSTQPTPPAHPPSASAPSPPPSSWAAASGTKSRSSVPVPEPAPAPAFKSSGWSSLDDSPLKAAPAVRGAWGASSTTPAQPPPPPPSSSRGGWNAVSATPQIPSAGLPLSPPPPPPPRSGWAPAPPAGVPPQNRGGPTARPGAPSKWSSHPPPSPSGPSNGSPAPPAHEQGSDPVVSQQTPAKPPAKVQPDQSRGNWQQWQKNRGSRK